MSQMLINWEWCSPPVVQKELEVGNGSNYSSDEGSVGRLSLGFLPEGCGAPGVSVVISRSLLVFVYSVHPL